jgi:hypothetical protein
VLTLRQGWAFHTRPSHDVWFFNPLAWQFLFVIGATAGYAGVTGIWPFPRAKWTGQAAIVLAVVIAAINFSWTLHWIWDPFPPLFAKLLWSYSLDKTNLAPLRLISFLVLAIATVSVVKPDSRFLQHRWALPVIICGQQSLYIFCLGIVLSVLGHFLLAEFSGGFFMQAGVNLVGVGTMIAVALLLNWFKNASRRPPRPASTSVSAVPSE